MENVSLRLSPIEMPMTGTTAHILRHTYATMAAGTGIAPKTLQSIMRHADIQTTMNCYAHRRMDKIEEAKETLKTMYLCRNMCQTSRKKQKGQKYTYKQIKKKALIFLMKSRLFSMAHPSGFEPKAFRLGVSKGVLSIGCCDVLLYHEIQQYQEKRRNRMFS